MTTNTQHGDQHSFYSPSSKDNLVPASTRYAVLESPQLDKLFASLCKAQSEMDDAKTQSANPYFKSKYANLQSIVKAARPFLSRNGLCVIQRTFTGEGTALILQTRLGHSSGQWIVSNVEVKPLKTDIQSLGSYLTYLRRYQYASLVGVITGEGDDDGEAAMPAARATTSQSPINPQKDNSIITKDQLEVLSSELSAAPEILDSVLKGFKITKLSDLSSFYYAPCLARIRSIKKSKEKGE